ncbi:Ig-like domain-containing protein [Thalassotalea agariperforans]
MYDHKNIQGEHYMKLLRQLSCLMLLFTIISCGGSGGSLSRDETDTGDGGGTGTTSDVTLTLSLSNDYVTNLEPAVVSATLMDGTTPLAKELITFSTSIGELSPSSGSALTDDSGIAVMNLTAGDVRGAGTVTASYGDNLSATINFSTQGDDINVGGDVNITIQLVNVDGDPTETITSSRSGQIIATVNGISAPVIVTFESTVGEIPIPTAITDSNNQAKVDILAGSDLGAGTITASIETGETGSGFIIIGSTTVSMGSGTPFVKGVANISLAQISAGGTSVVSVDIVDEEGNPFTEAINVNFTSSCSSSAIPTAIISSPISTSNGKATSTYLAQGCVGDDVINISASAGGINLSASGTINVLPADVGSIEFVSATPELIAIQGVASSGRPASSEVLFRVLDTNGNPVNSESVDFKLNSLNSEFTLTPTSATTDAEGYVRTVVNSGTVAGSVRITASITDSSPVISTQSSNLKASTGIPDQDSFSISASILNPEAWNIDGQEVEITARLADASNNPPPPTVVYFTTEGGSIDENNSSCTTDSSGSCSVIWRSQLPRPEGHVLGDINNLNHVPETINTMGQKYGGRATILATAVGEESFADLNGNGRFDLCESTAFLGGISKPCAADGSFDNSGADIVYSGNDVSGKPFDLKEAFVDHNEDGLFNPAENGGELGGELEEPSDFNNNGIFDDKDGKYNGVLCSLSTAVPNTFCSSDQFTDIRDSLVLVMSGSDAYFVTNSTSDAVSSMIDDDNDATTPDVPNPNFDATDDTIYIAGESVGSASVIISDLHNQPMPQGTTVSFIATVGSVQGASSFTWPNHNKNGGLGFGVSVKGQEEPATGVLLVQVTTPSGATSTYNAIRIVIQ